MASHVEDLLRRPRRTFPRSRTCPFSCGRAGDPARDCPRHRDRPRLRHESEDGGREEHHRPRRHDLLFLQSEVSGQVHGRAAALPEAGRSRTAGAREAGRDLHLPDASGDPPGRTRKLPDLRHGARAGRDLARQRTERRTPGHDAPLLDRADHRPAGRGAGDGQPSGRSARDRLAADVGVAADGVRLAGRTLGWLAVLRARRAVDRPPHPQHVHPDRDRHRRGLAVQHDRHPGARPVPGSAARRAWIGAGLFRGLGGRGGAGAARSGAGIARPRQHQRRDQGAARAGAAHGAQGRRG